MSAPTANELFRAAQDYLRQGQPVFPCRSQHVDQKHKAKAPLTKNGWQDASLDLGQVKTWWKRHGSNAAIGIPTGVVWDVLDVDVKGDADGRRHLPYLNRLGLLDGCQRVAKSPSGGWHLYFKTGGTGLTNKAHAKLGLDVRSTGGYVLAPPSWISVGDDFDDIEYEGAYVDHGETEGASDSPLFWDLILATLAPIDTDSRKPIELLGFERQRSLASLKGWLSERVSGERNNALHWAVCRCIDNGLDPHELLEVASLIGLREEESLLTIDSALRRAGIRADDLDTEAEALFPDED